MARPDRAKRFILLGWQCSTLTGVCGQITFYLKYERIFVRYIEVVGAPAVAIKNSCEISMLQRHLGQFCN